MSYVQQNKDNGDRADEGGCKSKATTGQFSDQRDSALVQLQQQRLMAAAPLQRMAVVEEEDELLQGKFVAQREGLDDEEDLLQGKFEPAQRAGKVNDTGMPDQLKAGVESLSGLSMDHVRVHYNSDKPAQLNAHAYAQGSEIHIGPGQEQHLPHEAWHVVQQAQGRVRPTVQMAGGVNVNDDTGLEREADLMGGRAISVNSLSHVQDGKQNRICPSLVAQFKLAVAVTGSISKQKDMKITDVRVFERTYPGEKDILGKKSKGLHRCHTIGWDLYKDAWEKKYLGKELGDMASELGCGETQVDVESAYAEKLESEAKNQVLFYGDGKSNMSGGQKYKGMKRKYEQSHDQKHSGKKLTSTFKKNHKKIKRDFASAALDMPSRKSIGYSQTEYEDLNDYLIDRRNDLIVDAHDTDDEGL